MNIKLARTKCYFFNVQIEFVGKIFICGCVVSLKKTLRQFFQGCLKIRISTWLNYVEKITSFCDHNMSKFSLNCFLYCRGIQSVRPVSIGIMQINCETKDIYLILNENMNTFDLINTRSILFFYLY